MSMRILGMRIHMIEKWSRRNLWESLQIYGQLFVEKKRIHISEVQRNSWFCLSLEAWWRMKRGSCFNRWENPLHPGYKDQWLWGQFAPRLERDLREEPEREQEAMAEQWSGRMVARKWRPTNMIRPVYRMLVSHPASGGGWSTCRRSRTTAVNYDGRNFNQSSSTTEAWRRNGHHCKPGSHRLRHWMPSWQRVNLSMFCCLLLVAYLNALLFDSCTEPSGPLFLVSHDGSRCKMEGKLKSHRLKIVLCKIWRLLPLTGRFRSYCLICQYFDRIL